MIVLIQRVAEASVSVEGRVTGAVGRGLLALVCGEPGDTPAVIGKLARKTARLRIFEDEAGRMNRSVVDVGGDVVLLLGFKFLRQISSLLIVWYSGAKVQFRVDVP